ncbi:hypothetical protein EAI_08970, partial [Harpegnathos saltator]
ITWVRRRDRQLLTVGTSTHSIDKRFVVRHSSTDWALMIRTVTVDDAGIYECQVTSHPVQRNFARLKITEAYSIIPGAPDLHVKQGSSLRLECQLMAATEKPLYVFWYRQGRMINYDEEPGVDVKLTTSGSILTVNKTKLTHDGNYTCVPSNAKAASVMVHVIEELETNNRRIYKWQINILCYLLSLDCNGNSQQQRSSIKIFTVSHVGRSANRQKRFAAGPQDLIRLIVLRSRALGIHVKKQSRIKGGEAGGDARRRQKEPQPGNFGEQLPGILPSGRQLEDTEFHEPLPDVNYRNAGGILRPVSLRVKTEPTPEETSSQASSSAAAAAAAAAWHDTIPPFVPHREETPVCRELQSIPVYHFE